MESRDVFKRRQHAKKGKKTKKRKIRVRIRERTI